MQIEPSILDARLDKISYNAISKFCRRIHLDIVPGKNFDTRIIKKLKKAGLIVDVHIMTEDVERKIKQYDSADIINIHAEDPRAYEYLNKIKCRKGIVLNPSTRVERAGRLISMADEVLLMSVHPGKGGQKYIDISHKIKKIRNLFSNKIIKVDGGIKYNILNKIKGCDYAIIGSYIFKSKDYVKILRSLSLRVMPNELRKDVIRMLMNSGSGHPAGSLGLAEVICALYFSQAKHDPKNPEMEERDYVILSNGHTCPVLYSALAKSGYFPEEELKTLRKFGSRLQGHPHRKSLPGLETTSGPLGSGISQAAGIALGLKTDGKDNRIFCITSDGEHDEGNTWEGIMFAAKYHLDNLTVIVDRNGIQLSGDTKEIMPIGDLKKKYRSFGWRCIEVNGNDILQVVRALMKKTKNKPTAIIAKITPGKNVSFMENNWKWHGKAPDIHEGLKALEELNEKL